MDDAVGQLLEAWRTNNRINLFLIDGISDEGMGRDLSQGLYGHDLDQATRYAIWDWDRI